MDELSHSHKLVKVQPSEKASFLSKLFFCWAPPLFYRGYKNKNIAEEYYVPLKSHRSEDLGNKLENEWKHECVTNSNPNLWRAIWKIIRLEFLCLGVLFVISEFVLKLSQPWLIGKLMNHYVSGSTSIEKEQCYLYGSLIILSNFLSVIVSHFYQLKIQHLGMKVRIGCCSLIYRKALKLSESNMGNIINLLSNDVNRFDLAAMHILQLFVAPIETIFIVYCLYVTVGPTSIAGIILLMLFIPLQMFLGKLTTSYRQKTAEKTDHRIKLMDEILNGIQVIKMFTWEKLFSQMVSQARKLEIAQIMKVSCIRAFNVSSMLFLNRSGIFLCIIVHVLTQKEINAKYVFVVSSFYAILRQTLTVYFPFGIQSFSETKVSIERMKNFLMNEETITSRESIKISDYHDENPDKTKPSGVYLENASVKRPSHSSSASNYVLQNVNFEVSANELVVVVGPVGSGKSTLLHAILKELPLDQGELNVLGNVSYASQEPWLFSGTVRQNIVFGSKFDLDKYKKIVRICQLEEDVSTLPNGDCALVGERGNFLSGGQKSRISLARALYKDADIYLLDEPFSAIDARVGGKIFQECILTYLKDKCRILVTHHASHLISAANKIYVLDKGILSPRTYEKAAFSERESDDNSDVNVTSMYKDTKKEPEEKNLGRISQEVYCKYARSGGNGHYLPSIFLASLFVLTQAAASGADYFVAFWVNLQQTDSTKNIFNLCIYIYVAIILATIIISITRSMIFFSYCMKASTNLHNQMFSRVIKAPMIFFKTTSIGKLLNRFSKDIGIIDETLPLILMDTFQVALIVFGSIALVTFVNMWMLVPTIIIFGFFYFFKTRFLAKSRKVKRLEAEARSPIYSHVHATVQGLATIRTYNVQTSLKSEFDRHQDLHSSAFYMFMTCNRAFGFWLDMNCVFYTAVVIIILMIMDAPVGNVGLSITQSINLIGLLQWGIRQWSELANQMISVERVVEYTEISQETDSKDQPQQPLQNWPINGEIKFESVSLKYFDKIKLSLDDLNFTIKRKEKIGIVGRTGAGKSSLVSALFRLHDEGTEGTILIDNVNIAKIPLETLRSKMSIIPQEPILFSGTLRDNLDPYHEFSDETLWKVLEDAELRSLVMGLPDDLYNEILQDGSNFSVGQRQLICLARAILRNNKIIIMDEATANIDLQTDYLIHQTIKKNFEDCTIVIIAHRLNTIMEAVDKVLVMNNGKMMEFDKPACLLQNSESFFSQFVNENKKRSITPMCENDECEISTLKNIASV